MSRLLIDGVASCVELSGIYLFFQFFMGKSPVDKKQRVLFYVAFLCMSLTVVTFSRNFHTTAISQVVMLVTLSRIYDNSIWKRLGYSLLIYIFSLLNEGISVVLTMNLFNIGLEQIEGVDGYYAFMAITSKALLLMTVVIIKVLLTKINEAKGGSIYVGLLLTPLASALAIYMIVENSHPENLMLAVVAAILLVFANLLVFYIFEKQSRIERNQMRLEFVEEQYEEQITHYNELYYARTETHKMWHDMNNLLLTLAAYAEADDMAGIRNFLSEHNHEMYNIRKIIDTNNPKIDAVISAKQRRIADCPISCTIPDLSEIGIEPMDIAMLLASALDNAVEACEKMPPDQKKQIRIRMSIQNQYLSICIENTAVDDFRIQDKCLKTTKQDELKHGFGLETIKRIAAKYQGDVSFQYENGWFILTALLKRQ